ncbi:hypothetical protein [Candidatus Villigracilis affinis]|uniref:ArnT family glycosyltransferase n=1 Tax=Candidatus Villigracilis affinis TaxID=3140682 RepID=UPI002A1AE461|nr:hypothetical protein [Anaerolineales bacterium]
MKKSIRILAAVLVIASMLLPRVSNLTQFTAADEPFWLVVGANYYYALTHGELENTVYEYHPAVTTMWIGTAAMLIYFPEYRGLMDGYFQQEKTTFDAYLIEHGKDPLTLLWWARLIQLLLNLSLFIAAFFFLKSLLDENSALIILLLTSFAPYLFGQSRMLNHESMVGLFSLLTILAMTAHLFLKPTTGLAILSAGFAAFANLTKSSAIVLFPVVAVMTAYFAWMQWRENRKISASLMSFFKIYGLWILAFFIVYFIAWPGMWVAPGKMLYEVYGNAFSYAFQGARLSVTQELEPSNFSLASAGLGVFDFLTSIAWRTTPVTWIGLVLAVIFFFSKNREVVSPLAKYLIAFLLLEAFACIGMFSLVQGRDQPHYVLASYYGFEFAAAIGWTLALRWISQSFAWAKQIWAQAGLVVVLLSAQMFPLFQNAPYYFTYLNPIMTAVAGRPSPFFYGERMEQAAAYLAQKPDAKDQTALVYFGRSFSYYYPGKTLLFKPILFDDKTQLIENLRESDYLVMYSGLEERLPLLKELTPEHVIELYGRTYVEIYRVADIPASFYK